MGLAYRQQSPLLWYVQPKIDIYLTKTQEHAKVEPGVTEAEALFSWVEAFQNDSITKYVVSK